MEVDLQRWFVLIIGFYVKPYFPVKEVCLDWQKLILQIQIQLHWWSYRFYSLTWCTKFRNGRIFSLSMLPLSPLFRIEEIILRFYWMGLEIPFYCGFRWLYAFLSGLVLYCTGTLWRELIPNVWNTIFVSITYIVVVKDNHCSQCIDTCCLEEDNSVNGRKLI
jgi:hypothetical protein